MFYHQLILTKKGLLGKVWLAAHWERKLTKAQVFETNVQSSVNEILHPKVKLALRTSGHLLLGIVRIYSKKAKYLLSDCNEVLAKLKLAFRPTSIDLPKSQQEARREAITLQHKNKLPMLDLEATSQSLRPDLHLDDMSEDELSERLSVARASRVEDITLRDDILAASRSDVSRNFDDNFGDVGFEDMDLLGDEPDMDIDIRSKHGERHQEPAEMDLDDDLLAPVAPPEVDIDMPPPAEPERDIMDDADMDLAGPVNDADEPAHPPRDSVLLNSEGFALPPLDLTTSANKMSRRRRKLIVDEFKNLTGEQIKQQLNDPSDLVGGLDLAPPSTTIMQLREAERSEKTAMTTATYYEANYICEELTRNLHFRISAPPVARLEDFCDFLGIDMSRSETTQTSEDRAHQAATLRELEDNAMLLNDAGMPGAHRASSQENPPTPPLAMAGGDLSDLQHAMLSGISVPADLSMPAALNGSAFADAQLDLLPLDVDIGPVMSPGGKRSRSPAGAAGKSGKKRKTQALEEVAEETEEGGDGQKEDEDLRMNPKTRQLFKTIQRNVQKRQQKAEPAAAVDANGKKKKIKASVMFGELIANQKSRKEVARRFYSLLVMTKLQAVHVQQKRPYADIKITAGGKFNKF